MIMTLPLNLVASRSLNVTQNQKSGREEDSYLQYGGSLNDA